MANTSYSTNTFYKKILNMHAISYYFLLLTLFISALLVLAFWFMSWKIWFVALLVMVAWTPLVLKIMTSIYQKYQWLALIFVMVIAQGGHTIEHTAQMVQLHIFHLYGAQASGLIGALNIEWVHLIWNSWVLLMCPLLLYYFRKNPWLWILFIFAIYHEIEHIVMVSVYIKTGVSGSPGLLAKGGLIGGGLPIIRPDLHFLYAVFEEALIIAAYYREIKKRLKVEVLSNREAPGKTAQA